MQKLIMFNGPPRAGKDTAGKICKSTFGGNVALVKFTTPIKKETHKRYGLQCAPEAYEDLKDTPLEEFDGRTPREAYTAVSADMKATFGPLHVARLLVQEVAQIAAPIIVNTDVGYDYEARELQSVAGPANTILIRLHRDGRSFESDCRNWVRLEGSRDFDIENNQDPKALEAALKPILESFTKPGLSAYSL